MKVTTLTCLFVSKDGRLAVRLMDAPVPSQHEIPVQRVHACRILGPAGVRLFKRTVEGALPVYEEV
jgi:hypothetical protein